MAGAPCTPGRDRVTTRRDRDRSPDPEHLPEAGRAVAPGTARAVHVNNARSAQEPPIDLQELPIGMQPGDAVLRVHHLCGPGSPISHTVAISADLDTETR